MKDENDHFDFNKFNKELMEYELGYGRLGHSTFCGVCRGCSEETNDMHIPVVRQINDRMLRRYALWNIYFR
ncbi:MAG: hypothetical protein OSJ61_16810 [Lachnospiraceae bacterium]|nr:hypothetical protein [Lachnospiraceae bacterium]